MTAYTMPDLQNSAGHWLTACLWSCLGYFAIDTAIHARIAMRTAMVRSYLLSASGFIDLIGVIAVPIALVCGVEPDRKSVV